MSGTHGKRVLPISKETQPYRTELTPVAFLRRSAYVFPDALAVVHGERRYTYRQFEERVNRLASGLRAAGLRHLDRVAFICPNTPAMLERSEEHTSELQSQSNLVCRLLLEKKKK